MNDEYYNSCAGISVEELFDYITNLQEKVEQYENPDDMTLFYMWLDIKAKDKMKQLEECYCNRTDCIGRIKDSKKYNSVYQEKEDYKSRCDKVNKYIEDREKDDDNWIEYELLIEPSVIKNILEGNDE